MKYSSLYISQSFLRIPNLYHWQISQSHDCAILTPSNTSTLCEFIHLLSRKPYGCLIGNSLDTLPIIKLSFYIIASMNLQIRNRYDTLLLWFLVFTQVIFHLFSCQWMSFSPRLNHDFHYLSITSTLEPCIPFYIVSSIHKNHPSHQQSLYAATFVKL